MFNPRLHTDLWTYKRISLYLWLESNEKSIKYKNSGKKKRNIVNTIVKQDERKKERSDTFRN